jgi:hypothetical protein
MVEPSSHKGGIKLLRCLAGQIRSAIWFTRVPREDNILKLNQPKITFDFYIKIFKKYMYLIYWHISGFLGGNIFKKREKLEFCEDYTVGEEILRPGGGTHPP